MAIKEQPVALVTGGTRGIGHEVARQLIARDFRVIITGRSQAAADEAAKKLGPAAISRQLEMSAPDSFVETAEWIRNEVGRLDSLVNNAAILLGESETILSTKPELFEQSVRTNSFGPLLLTRALVSLLHRSRRACVVNVSSGAGQISRMTTYAPAYSISKATLNAVTVMLAAALPFARVNCVDPGWVKTDMGGPNAPRDVEKGAETIVWLATLTREGPTGGFFKDKKKIAW